jgi:hypothetical protein
VKNFHWGTSPEASSRPTTGEARMLCCSTTRAT